MNRQFSILAFLCLTACSPGKIDLIERARFELDIESETITATFEMLESYHLGSNFEFAFDRLGEIRTENSGGQLKIEMFLHPELDRTSLPGEPLLMLGGSHSLPRVFRSPELLYLWTQGLAENSIGFVYGRDEHLKFGSIIQNDAFQHLPENFYGVQEIKDRGGKLRGLVALFGPQSEKDTLGGIAFLCDFGLNPFEMESSEPLVIELFPDRDSSGALPSSFYRRYLRQLRERLKDLDILL